MKKLRTALVTATAALAFTTLAPAPAQALTPGWEWHQDYYNNYFRSWLKCVSRGEGAIGHRTHDQLIRFAVAYLCHRPHGDTKYSMDILFHFPRTFSWEPER